jgi:hypothetical protein
MGVASVNQKNKRVDGAYAAPSSSTNSEKCDAAITAVAVGYIAAVTQTLWSPQPEEDCCT